MTHSKEIEPTEAVQSEQTRELDATALSALAHPIRMQIFDILTQYGPQTASSLAELLHESTGATSYHLRELARHELIQELPERGTGRERWWERPKGKVILGSQTATATPSGRVTSQIVLNEFYQRRHEQLLRFLQETANTGGAGEDALLSATVVRLTPEQFDQFISEVEELLDRWLTTHKDQSGEEFAPYLIRADMFPLPALSEKGAST